MQIIVIFILLLYKDNKIMYDARLQTPFTCLLVGESNSGKTFLLNEILKNKDIMFTKKPDKTVLFYMEYQPIYDIMLKNKAIDEVHKGMPDIDKIKEIASPYKKSNGTCVIFDDCLHDITPDLSRLFTTYSHHLNISIFFVTQNLFHQNKEYRTMSLNSSYLILMGGARNASQIMTFARQISPYKSSYIIEAFKAASKNKPYSYLLLDFKQNVPDHIRVRTNILPHQLPMIVYLEKT